MALFCVDDYKNMTSSFLEHLYIFSYDGLIREKIIDYKFNEKNYLYMTFLNFLKKNEKFCVQIKKYDIIIPIPISRKRYKERGYNQSSIFAKNIAKSFDIKYIDKALIKVKNNYPQSSLKKENREENVKNTYKMNEKYVNNIINKKVLIVDDIFTTGNTVNECAHIIKKNGSNIVGVLTIAKD